MHYLITGHTGFKGTWLALLLLSRGHTVSGLALDPLPGSLFEKVRLSEKLIFDQRVDIRDSESTINSISEIGPDVVFHLAAQPLVRESYRNPRFTFETNVLGTLNVLEGVSKSDSIKAHVVITTDKVYKNLNQVEGYKETDALGGDDPYSSSKAMADLLTQSWVTSFPGVPTAIARAGNVIGGGDVSAERLLVDLISNFQAGNSTEIRYPNAVRPWQHVLDCVNGYVVLSDALLQGSGQGIWNFGPGIESFVTVGQVSKLAAEFWGSGADWHVSDSSHFHEAGLLALNSERALSELSWRNKLPFPRSLEWTLEWHLAEQSGEDPEDICEKQIHEFLSE